MPYAHTKLRIPRELDRRVKITPEKRAEIVALYKVERLAQRAIARQTGISRRMISFILFPEREALCRAQYKERRSDGRYYHKEKWRVQMRNHRRYKQSIRGKLIEKCYTTNII